MSATHEKKPAFEKFWMVWGLEQSMPRYKHHSKQSATNEAKRLSALVPGDTFVVLAVVDAYTSEMPVPKKLSLAKPFDDGIPF